LLATPASHAAETFLRERCADRFADSAQREIVATLKRLRPQYLTLWKYSYAHHRFVQYPNDHVTNR